MLTLDAPAKLNLYLRVVGKRPDGFHELETLFEILDLHDTLHFEPHPTELSLTCSHPDLPTDEGNLVYRAAQLLRQSAQVKAGAQIHLEKRIPHAAGLGGGSSDAATTLKGLNQLWRLGWSHEQLWPLAAELGADVPLFLEEGGFWKGTARGDEIEPIDTRTHLAHVLVVPPAKLLTKDVFSAEFDLTSPKPSITLFALALRNGSLCELAQEIWNDLQPEAIRRCPVIQRIQDKLNKLGCLASCVSGSGPSVFGLCQDQEHAKDVVQQLRQGSDHGWWIESVSTRHSQV